MTPMVLLRCRNEDADVDIENISPSLLKTRDCIRYAFDTFADAGGGDRRVGEAIVSFIVVVWCEKNTPLFHKNTRIP